MLTIRLRKRQFKSVLSKNILEFIVIKKGKALTSRSQEVVLGTYNKKMNIILVNFDLLYYWVAQGSQVSTPAYKLLRSLFF